MNLLQVAACALLVSCAATAQAACRIKRVELPVHMEGSRAITTLVLDGTPVPMVVDSGAFFSTITRATADQLGLKTRALPDGFSVQGLTGRMVNPRKTTVKKVQVQKTELPGIEFLVGGNDSGLGAMGLLGRNILELYDTEYDLAHGVIRFVIPNEECDKANMAYWAGDTPVSEVDLMPSDTDLNPAIRAKLELNGRRIIALFDTGASTIVSLDAAHDAGVKDADLGDNSVTHGIGDGRLNYWTASFASVALGGEIVRHNRLGVSDFDAHGYYDMLVGIDFFLSHRIYVSSANSRMFFTYNGGPVFARNVEAKADAASAPASQAADTLSADALFRRGTASLARKDNAAALADLDRACAMEPANAGFFLARARVRMNLDEPTKALADLDTALTLDPKLDEARLLRVAAAPRDAGSVRALQDLTALDASLPAGANMRWSMAEAYDQLGQPALAIRQWTLWIDSHRDDVMVPEARNGRCWARMETAADLDKAMADCDDAIGEQSDNANFRDSRGWLQLRLNRPSKAMADFDRALRTNPTKAWSLYGRALAHMKLGEAAAARTDLATARKLDPKVDDRLKARGLETMP